MLVFALSFGSRRYLHEKRVSNAVLAVETRRALEVCGPQRLRLRRARRAWVWYTGVVVRRGGPSPVLPSVRCRSCDRFYSPSRLLFVVWKLSDIDVVENLVALGCLLAVVVDAWSEGRRGAAIRVREVSREVQRMGGERERMRQAVVGTGEGSVFVSRYGRVVTGFRCCSP